MLRRTILQNMIDSFIDTSKKRPYSIYAKLEPKDIFDLLNEVSGKYRTKVTHLLQRLAANRWYILCDPHEGGSVPDSPMHITLRVQDKGIHLNCKKNRDETLYIYEITEY